MIFEIRVRAEVLHGDIRLALAEGAETVVPIQFDTDDITEADVDAVDLVQAAMASLIAELGKKADAKIVDLRGMIERMAQDVS